MTLLCKWFGWFCAAAPTPAPILNPIKEEPKPPISKEITSENIDSIVMQNGCKDAVFGNRGKPNIGFLVGMSKAYLQTKCDADLNARLTKAPHSANDAYSRYGLKPTLPNIYGFMVGLAAQESSFKACTGRDMTAGWTQSDEAESGLFQTSYNSNGFSKYLSQFFKAWNKQGFEADFYRTVKCSAADWKYWGDKPDGLRFQKLSKEKPAFQLEYTALLLKETYKHHGPIVRREVKVKQECIELFEKVDKISCEQK